MSETSKTELEPIDAKTVRRPWDVREINEQRRRPEHAGECFICGRGLTLKATASAQHLHLTTGYEIVRADAEVDESDDQGWFPVGSECARRVPATHLRKFTETVWAVPS